MDGFFTFRERNMEDIVAPRCVGYLKMRNKNLLKELKNKIKYCNCNLLFTEIRT